MTIHEQTDDQASDEFSDVPPANVTDDALDKTSREPQSLWIISAALGLFVLVISVYFPSRSAFKWAFDTVTWQGTANLILWVASLFIGLLLVIYAFALRRIHRQGGATTSPAVTGVLVPVVLWVFGMTAIVVPFAWVQSTAHPAVPSQPCLELYNVAISAHREKPNFKMPVGDPDERRCEINKMLALLG